MDYYKKSTIGTNYPEIQNLKTKLSLIGIKSELETHDDGYRLTVLGINGFDAVENRYSYGSKDDLIEIMGLLTSKEEEFDEVIGNLTAEEVFARICEYFIDNSTKYFRVVQTCDNWSDYYDQNYNYIATKCDGWDDPVTNAFVTNAKTVKDGDPVYNKIMSYYMTCDNMSYLEDGFIDTLYFFDKNTKKQVAQFEDWALDNNLEYLKYAKRAD